MKNPIGDNQEVNIQYKQIQITQKKKKRNITKKQEEILKLNIHKRNASQNNNGIRFLTMQFAKVQ